MHLPFTKVEGAGNDLVLVDRRAHPVPDPAALARDICERRRGVGGDGLLLIEHGADPLPHVRMFNPDGTEDFCGNGLRCAAAWLTAQGEGQDGEIAVSTPYGRHHGRVTPASARRFEVEIELLAPAFSPDALAARASGDRLVDYPLRIAGCEWRATSVALGTVHTVIFLSEPLDDTAFLTISPQIENHPLFRERTSVLWCRVESPDRIHMRIWERGVGETLSCGSGACAAVTVGCLLGLTTGRARVITRGGALEAAWDGRGPVRLTGPARLVYTGVYETHGVSRSLTKEVPMTQPSRISDALGVAVQMEQEGQRFYAEAARRMTQEFGRRMFESLAKDEMRHEAIFREMAAKEGVRPAAASEMDQSGPVQRIREIFRAAAKSLKQNVKPTDDDIAVMRKALELEEKAYAFYSATAAQSRNASEKGILRKIAAEENDHYRILDDTILYLTNPSEWHIKEERPVIDGG